MSEDVTYEVSEGVATLTLNRPDRMNTISGPMLDELTRLLVKAGEDRDVRVIVLTGTGRAFCAGLDLNAASKGEGIGSSSATFGATIDLRNTPPTVLHALDKPVIAALNGSAAGYGMDLALGCDIRVMASEAKLAAAFVKRGVLPESGGTWFLPRMIGWAKAAEIVFTGRTLSAEDCLKERLVNEVVPADQVAARMLSLPITDAMTAADAHRAAEARRNLPGIPLPREGTVKSEVVRSECCDSVFGDHGLGVGVEAAGCDGLEHLEELCIGAR